jgi:hypothetical protein
MPGRRAAPPPPILKQDLNAGAQGSADALPFTSCTSIHSTRVHFPPTPKLTCRELTYPSHAYDRAPIVVTPNSCALPSRGAREYHAPIDEEARARARKPRFAPVVQQTQPQSLSSQSIPASCYFATVPAAAAPADALSWSSSSESDDSDTSVSTPPPAADAGYHHHPPPGLAPPTTLSFLPHASASPPKEKRRRSATPCRSRRAAKPASFVGSSFGDDSGCLGGF